VKRVVYILSREDIEGVRILSREDAEPPKILSREDIQDDFEPLFCGH
jgi:hypothetical protein